MARVRETGASDIVFWDAPKVTAYSGWKYALMLAGADQAARWRPAPDGQPDWKSTELPELMFAQHRSWTVSFLWDDDWACIGGSEALVGDLLSDPVLVPNARRVDTKQRRHAPGRLAGVGTHQDAAPSRIARQTSEGQGLGGTNHRGRMIRSPPRRR